MVCKYKIPLTRKRFQCIFILGMMIGKQLAVRREVIIGTIFQASSLLFIIRRV